ncbi:MULTISPECIES: molybdopterin synthase sulfur carrier subunit [Tatumella]|uniref:Molybdopterin synthase sulfur carrier subunit n=1 Tax=Tatumella punctata TaxID=399969 RepID=A0ABW1VNQ0_9GAMM|nr:MULTISPECIES: molybdopterin synthase sulfur carrier subunit [unclassified Tatumella]MBS0854658.1 molybdopterin synthase sulfur carrier subunit [Tatumella sp. JGM16]MBS0875927.1 molybdopterin synthase sulfur carrier subunit [Tatumella sp. JGM82]MBS0890332.1 molybdopterin synthase sulfur carrier subunit [Tatumella sp. JGM94]MBS0892561.1 molybdopterin synthase sulfur carrier subunit [Tatumella sp. JGM130]MBS0900458.1 molybdopterin synthase sulfur carrier subunit [Tatumella sp. JGM100]
MINVLLFARVRELAGTDGVTVAAEYSDAESLRLALSLKDSRWAMALEQGKLLVAVNQTLVPFSHPLQDGDEVAFFPPVTGG